MENHTEQLDKIISKIIQKYAVDNNIKIVSDSNYDNGIIKIKVYE